MSTIDCTTTCSSEQTTSIPPLFLPIEPEPITLGDRFRAIAVLDTLPILVVSFEGVREVSR